MSGSELELSRGERAKAAAKLMVGWVALLWLLEVVDVASGHALDGLGITPRTPSELVDVVPAAFIHFASPMWPRTASRCWSWASSRPSAACAGSPPSAP